jgi:hypothetical protein
VRVFSQSGSAVLDLQKGNLRSRFPAPFIPFKGCRPAHSITCFVVRDRKRRLD